MRRSAHERPACCCCSAFADHRGGVRPPNPTSTRGPLVIYERGPERGAKPGMYSNDMAGWLDDWVAFGARSLTIRCPTRGRGCAHLDCFPLTTGSGHHSPVAADVPRA